MKITLLTVGKIKEKYFTMAIDEYAKRLSRYVKLDIVEVADEKTPDGASETEERMIRDKEGKRILANLKDDSYVITLEIEGKMLDSVELSLIMRSSISDAPSGVFSSATSTISSFTYLLRRLAYSSIAIVKYFSFIFPTVSNVIFILLTSSIYFQVHPYSSSYHTFNPF